MKSKINYLYDCVKEIYQEIYEKIPYHGITHIEFVRKKSIFFSQDLKADDYLVETAAILHDINYTIDPNSSPNIAQSLRQDLLLKSKYSNEDIMLIEKIIIESHRKNRNHKISLEGMALSDADTLFKSLPITPILFANNYIKQVNTSVEDLANEIIKYQEPLLKSKIYFYSNLAKQQYLNWAETNLKLWSNVADSLSDPDIAQLVNDYEKRIIN